MAGAVLLVVVLLLSPLLITLSLVGVAAVLGSLLDSDAATRHAGSSLIDTNI